MVAFAEVAQAVDRLQKMADVGLPALQSALPPIEQAGREVFRRAIAGAASTAQQVSSGVVGQTTVAIGSDLGVDAVASRIDPTKGLDPHAFSIEGGKSHPWIKEDLANLTHATAERERIDRERGRGGRESFINPVPHARGLVPWASPEPPQMREGASTQSRQPLMRL